MNKEDVIKVYLKFRAKYNDNDKNFKHLEFFEDDKQKLIVKREYEKRQFIFNKIFNMNCNNNELLYEIADPKINGFLEGFNETILAYGQTGSGKTYTIIDTIIPYVISNIFKLKKFKNEIYISCLQIYNETITDLFETNKKIIIREDKNVFFCDNLSKKLVNNEEEAFKLLKLSIDKREIGCNDINKKSSRSHIIFSIICKNKNIINTFNLVDLAGSERMSKTNLFNDKTDETISINQSLTCLGKCIIALGNKKSQYIPFRESKLTKLLKNSLGGNSKTSLIINLSPNFSDLEETLSSLNFGSRACKVKLKNIKKPSFDLLKLENLQEELDDKNNIIEELENEVLLLTNQINSLQFKINNLEENNKDVFEKYYELKNKFDSNQKTNIFKLKQMLNVDGDNNKLNIEIIENFMNTDYMNSFENLGIIKESTKNVKKNINENKENNNLNELNKIKMNNNSNYIEDLLNEVNLKKENLEIDIKNLNEINLKIIDENKLLKKENEKLKNEIITEKDKIKESKIKIKNKVNIINKNKLIEIENFKEDHNKMINKLKEDYNIKINKLKLEIQDNLLKNIQKEDLLKNNENIIKNDVFENIKSLFKIDKDKDKEIFDLIVILRNYLNIINIEDLNLNELNQKFIDNKNYYRNFFKDIIQIKTENINIESVLYDNLNKLLLGNLNNNNSLSSNIYILSKILIDLIKNKSIYNNQYSNKNFKIFFNKFISSKNNLKYIENYLKKKKAIKIIEKTYKTYKNKLNNKSINNSSYIKFQAGTGKYILQVILKEIENKINKINYYINKNINNEESFYIELNKDLNN